MPLTVLAIADQVSPALYDSFRVERWRDVDLILSCGDLPPDYLDFLCSSLDVPILYVRGNHDGVFDSSRYDGCENVHGKIVTCKGIRIVGFQGSHRYNNGPYQYTEAQMRRIVRRARLQSIRTGPPEIVLTHAPLAGCHDGSDICHRGFECFNKAVEAWRPQFFIHGHTHAYDGWSPVSQIGSTSVINAYPYHVFKIEVPVKAESQFGLISHFLP
jgi:Icc-related predicted phosphoesterase